jgi:hypothetical protein
MYRRMSRLASKRKLCCLLKHRREDKRERERGGGGVCGDFLKALKTGRKA